MRLDRTLLVGALTALALLAAVPHGTAQDDPLQRAYAAIEPRIHAEYEFHSRGMAQHVIASGAPISKITEFQKRLRLLTYNRAVLIANCLAEVDRDRPPNAAAVPTPPQNNLVLVTCIEEKLRGLQKFSDMAAYADYFFPDRVDTCGAQARLPDQEQQFEPYAFLALEQREIYDFARYNECLMTQPP